MDLKDKNLAVFSIEGYSSWKTRVRKMLLSKHHRMNEVLTSGPIIIKEKVTHIPTNPKDGDVTEEWVVKQPIDFTPEEAKVSQLDIWAQTLIMSTVGQDYLPRIDACDSAKHMWETLASISEGCEEIKNNKFNHACQDFDSFSMKKEESIDQMEIRFQQIVAKIESIRQGKYTLKDKNLKVLQALPEEWDNFTNIHEHRKDIGEIETEKLFSILKGNEYKVLRRRAQRSAALLSRQEDEGSATKNVALRAEGGKSKFSRPTRSADYTPREKSSNEASLQKKVDEMTKRMEEVNSKLARYRRFYKNKRGDGESQKAQTDGCFECGKSGHFKMDCPDLSKKDRDALRARAKAKAMVAEEEAKDTDIFTDTEDEDDCESLSDSADKVKCLMAIEESADNEVTSNPPVNNILPVTNESAGDTSLEISPTWEDIEQLNEMVRIQTAQCLRCVMNLSSLNSE